MKVRSKQQISSEDEDSNQVVFKTKNETIEHVFSG